jgi:hypothetical protein
VPVEPVRNTLSGAALLLTWEHHECPLDVLPPEACHALRPNAGGDFENDPEQTCSVRYSHFDPDLSVFVPLDVGFSLAGDLGYGLAGFVAIQVDLSPVREGKPLSGDVVDGVEVFGGGLGIGHDDPGRRSPIERPQPLVLPARSSVALDGLSALLLQ